MTGLNCGSIPAQRSLEDWISVLSKPYVARMETTTLQRWEGKEGEGRSKTKELKRFLDFFLHHCIYWLLRFVWKLSPRWHQPVGAVLHKHIKFSMSGPIYTAGSRDCLAGNKLIQVTWMHIKGLIADVWWHSDVHTLHNLCHFMFIFYTRLLCLCVSKLYYLSISLSPLPFQYFFFLSQTGFYVLEPLVVMTAK